MKMIHAALACAGFAVPALAAQEGNSAQGADGVVMVQRNVYVPVNENGRVAGNDVLVVERQAFIPAEAARDDSGAASRASAGTDASGQAHAAPTTVVVLVPEEPQAGSNASGEKRFHMRKLDQAASNDSRCSKLSGSLPAECASSGGTGAAATASTQGQSGR